MRTALITLTLLASVATIGVGTEREPEQGDLKTAERSVNQNSRDPGHRSTTKRPPSDLPTLRDGYLPPPWRSTRTSISRVPEKTRRRAQLHARKARYSLLTEELKCGLIVEAASDALVAHLGGGVLVRGIVPDSRAAEWGLQRFDLVVALHGVETPTICDLVHALSSEPETPRIVLVRNGCQLEQPLGLELLDHPGDARDNEAPIRQAPRALDGAKRTEEKNSGRPSSVRPVPGSKSLSISCTRNALRVWNVVAEWTTKDGQVKRCEMQGDHAELEAQLKSLPPTIAAPIRREVGLESPPSPPATKELDSSIGQ